MPGPLNGAGKYRALRVCRDEFGEREADRPQRWLANSVLVGTPGTAPGELKPRNSRANLPNAFILYQEAQEGSCPKRLMARTVLVPEVSSLLKKDSVHPSLSRPKKNLRLKMQEQGDAFRRLVPIPMHERISLAKPDFFMHFYLAKSGLFSHQVGSKAWLGRSAMRRPSAEDNPHKTSLIMILTFGHEIPPQFISF